MGSEVFVLALESPIGLITMKPCLRMNSGLAPKNSFFHKFKVFTGVTPLQYVLDIRLSTAKRLLVETDAPYLSPVPFRGQLNQPAYVKYTAQHVATLRGQTFEKIARRLPKLSLFCGELPLLMVSAAAVPSMSVHHPRPAYTTEC